MSNFFKELKNKHVSPSVRISNDIRNAIKGGELKSGELLPAERKIADSYKVNYSTVRKATQVLVEEGLLLKQRGKGILIRDCNITSENEKIKKIGILLNNISWDHPTDVARIDTVSKSLTRRGIELTLASSDGSDVPEILLQGGVQGIILLGKPCRQQLLRLVSSGIPNISIGYSANSNIKYVDSDEYSIGFSATEILIKKGHEKIVFAGNESDDFRSHGLRRMGYMQAMEEYNLKAKLQFINMNCNDIHERKRVTAELQEATPTALIMSSKTYAEFMSGVLEEANMKVPDDVSVISLGAIALNMPLPANLSFDAVGCRYVDITELAVSTLLSDIIKNDDAEDFATSYLMKAVYHKCGSVKEIK